MIDRDEEKVERILRHLLALRGKGSGRADCLDEETLASYLSGMVAENPSADVEAHLADCSFCLAEVIAAHKATQESDTEEAHRLLMERVMALIPTAQAGPAFLDLVVRLVKDSVELVSTSGRLIPTMALVGIRGRPRPSETSILQVVKEMGRLNVEVEVERVENRLCQVVVRVRGKEGRVVEGVRLSLFSGDREQASYLTRQGEAVFDRVAEGEYNLAISDSGASVGRIRLRIME